jgi:hypothetical protein
MDRRIPAWRTLGARVLGRAAFGVALLCVVGPAAGAELPASGGGTAMRMYRDPSTGAIGVPSPDALGAPRAAEKVQANTTQELVREPVVAPAGGVKVNLQGRFHAIVTRHANGSRPGGHECAQTGGAAQ